MKNSIKKLFFISLSSFLLISNLTSCVDTEENRVAYELGYDETTHLRYFRPEKDSNSVIVYQYVYTEDITTENLNIDINIPAYIDGYKVEGIRGFDGYNILPEQFRKYDNDDISVGKLLLTIELTKFPLVEHINNVIIYLDCEFALYNETLLGVIELPIVYYPTFDFYDSGYSNKMWDWFYCCNGTFNFAYFDESNEKINRNIDVRYNFQIFLNDPGSYIFHTDDLGKKDNS